MTRIKTNPNLDSLLVKETEQSEENALPTDLMSLSKLAKKYNQNRVKLWRETKGRVLVGLEPLYEFYDTNPIQVSEAVFVAYMNSLKNGKAA